MQPFAAGQVWTYRTRPGEEASRIVVCQVEQLPQFGEVVHIYVNGLRLKNKHVPSGICHEVIHLPYKADALRQCLLHLQSTGAPLPPFEEGYNEWHAAFTSEGAGVFMVPVADILAGTEAATGK